MSPTIDEASFLLFCYPGAAMDSGRGRRPLTEQQEKIYNLASVGWKPAEIARRMGKSEPVIRDALAKIKHNGWLN